MPRPRERRRRREGCGAGEGDLLRVENFGRRARGGRDGRVDIAGGSRGDAREEDAQNRRGAQSIQSARVGEQESSEKSADRGSYDGLLEEAAEALEDKALAKGKGKKPEDKTNHKSESCVPSSTTKAKDGEKPAAGGEGGEGDFAGGPRGD